MPVKIEPFRAMAIGRRAYDLAATGRSVIHMEFGQPSTGAPAAAVAEADRVLHSDPMGYWESPQLKARIARHYRETYEVSVDPEQIFLTCGASPAFVLALSCLFDPGARVALARPGYVAYRNALKAMHLEPVELPCGEAERFQVSAQALEGLDPAPEGLIIASPANPTGTIIPAEEMAAIADLCRRRNVRIISDEIYHGLTYVEPARSILQDDGNALVINSFSKYFSMAGWRLGWLIVPEDLVDVARARMGNLFLTPPSLSQHAGLAAFDCRDELDGHLLTYTRNRLLLLEALPRMGLRRIAPPDGAFYIYADVGHLTADSFAFCLRMLDETGVATAPGIDFDPVDGHRSIRFSFAVSTEEVRTAIERLEPWFAERSSEAPVLRNDSNSER